mgnify:CR=1 FL=1
MVMVKWFEGGGGSGGGRRETVRVARLIYILMCKGRGGGVGEDGVARGRVVVRGWKSE